jgi:hypothetical protein
MVQGTSGIKCRCFKRESRLVTRHLLLMPLVLCHQTSEYIFLFDALVGVVTNKRAKACNPPSHFLTNRVSNGLAKFAFFGGFKNQVFSILTIITLHNQRFFANPFAGLCIPFDNF